jgi:hypothetical protein
MNSLTETQSVYASPFTAADKRECLPLIETIIKLANLARKEGVLALEEAAIRLDSLFLLQKGLLLVVDGTDPSIIREILENFIISSHLQGAELLRQLMSLEGTLAIQAGENPRIIEEKLLSLLGEQFYEEAQAYIRPEPQSHDALVKEYFNDMTTETFPEGTNLLEGVFSQLSNRDIQMVLRELSERDFLLAFRGSSKKIQRRLCNNLSVRMASFVVNSCVNEPMPATKDILLAQQEVQNVLRRLFEAGELIARTGNRPVNTVVTHYGQLTQEEIQALLSAGEAAADLC